jgi:hypothetical protein
MTTRRASAFAVSIAVLWGTATTAAQAPAPQAAPPAAKAAPKTPWGHPDLQGTWDYRTITPLERPEQYGDRAFLTEEEARVLEDRAGKRMDLPPEKIQPGLNHAQYWTDPGRRVDASRRTSLIVEPANGRIPPLTAAGRVRLAQRPRRDDVVDSWLDRSNAERCITYGLPSASLPTLYNNNIKIVQSPDSVVIVHEMIHEARVVPLDDRPPLPGTIRQWIGDTRGRWDGDTLVVETTNFSGQNNYRGSTTGLHLIERYRRVGANALELRLTVEDASTWTQPWTVVLPMIPTEGDIGEYACHEGNYGLRDILEVARDAEKAAAAKSKQE